MCKDRLITYVRLVKLILQIKATTHSRESLIHSKFSVSYIYINLRVDYSLGRVWERVPTDFISQSKRFIELKKEKKIISNECIFYCLFQNPFFLSLFKTLVLNEFL